MKLETIPEIIAKKVYYRGSEVKARDVFDIATAARSYGSEVLAALKGYPVQVALTLERLNKRNPEFVRDTIGQLMILPDFIEMAPESLATAKSLPGEALDD